MIRCIWGRARTLPHRRDAVLRISRTAAKGLAALPNALLVAAMFATVPAARAIEETWVYSVQVSAGVQAEPARIELTWTADSHPVSGFTVYRKSPGETTWGNGVELPGSATQYVDESVAIGTIYEYQIVQHANFPHNGPAYTGYGYIATGINAPLIQQSGRIILILPRSDAPAAAGRNPLIAACSLGHRWNGHLPRTNQLSTPKVSNSSGRNLPHPQNRKRFSSRTWLFILMSTPGLENNPELVNKVNMSNLRKIPIHNSGITSKEPLQH